MSKSDSSIPQWLSNLESSEIEFIKEFILASGSLKDIAKIYDVSYPTVRLRLDRLINKIEISCNKKDDEFISLIKYLAIENKITIDIAKLLINTYREGNNK